MCIQQAEVNIFLTDSYLNFGLIWISICFFQISVNLGNFGTILFVSTGSILPNWAKNPKNHTEQTEITTEAKSIPGIQDKVIL